MKGKLTKEEEKRLLNMKKKVNHSHNGRINSIGIIIEVGWNSHRKHIRKW